VRRAEREDVGRWECRAVMGVEGNKGTRLPSWKGREEKAGSWWCVNVCDN
jgi:hypothetical protein